MFTDDSRTLGIIGFLQLEAHMHFVTLPLKSPLPGNSTADCAAISRALKPLNSSPSLTSASPLDTQMLKWLHTYSEDGPGCVQFWSEVRA